MTEQYGEYDDGSESSYDYEEQQQPNRQPPEQRSNAEWAALRKERNAHRKAQDQLRETQKALAFMQAGIDPADPRLGYFVRGYQGEVSPQAIKQAAVEAGFVQAPQNGPTPEQQQQLGSQARMSAAAAAATPVDTGGEAQMQALNEAYAQGGTAAVVAKLVELGVPIQAT